MTDVMPNAESRRNKVPIEIFFYYSVHEQDEKLRQGLAQRLQALEKQKLITCFFPSEITGGTEEAQIKERLNSANLIVILISPDLFILKDYQDYETLIMERHEQDKIRVIPILLRSYNWEDTIFNQFAPLPKNNKFITDSDNDKNQDQVLTNVYEGIREIVQKIYDLKKDIEIPVTTEKLQDKSQTERIKRWFKSIQWHSVRNVFLSSMSISFVVILVRFFGALEPSELWLFDNMMRLKRPEDPDKNILIIQVTPEDIRNQGSEQRQGSLTNTTLLEILKKLLQNPEKIRPKVIGFDIHREFKTENPELSKLLEDNKNNPIFAVCYVGDKTQQNSDGVKPPPEFINKRLGFSDFLPDKDGIVRRHTLIMDKSFNSSFCRSSSDDEPITNAFSLELARHFLKQYQQILPNNDGNFLKIGNTVFPSIFADYRGGYSMFSDLNGYQILLNYRITCINQATCSPENVAPKVTVADVLKPDFLQRYKDFVKDKIVLIGVTDSTWEAPWTTPLYSKSHRQISGVIIQAQMISQIINAVLEKRPLLQVWSIWLEISWIFGWSLIGGTLFQSYRNNQKLTVLGVGVIVFLILPISCYMMFIIPMIWIPCIPAILSFMGTGGVILFFKLKSQKSS